MSYVPVFHQGDSGNIIRTTVKERNDSTGALAAVDISSATAKKFYLRDPAGRLYTVDATFTTDGTDGKLQYVVPTTLFPLNEKNLLGEWTLQVGLTNVSSWSGRSTASVCFELLPSLR